jgi:hypothetical protein
MAAQPEPEPAVMRASTVKSLNEFGSCFTATQDRASRPWAFMPTGNGGTFTNAGAEGIAAPYWLTVSVARGPSQIRLFANSGSADMIQAVNSCR